MSPTRKKERKRRKKEQRRFGNRVRTKNRISGDVKRCPGTLAVSGTSIQVTSYPGARPPGAFTGVPFRFPSHAILSCRRSLPRLSSRERIASSHHQEAGGLLFARDDRLPAKSRGNIRIGERNFDESPNDSARIAFAPPRCDSRHLTSRSDEEILRAI